MNLSDRVRGILTPQRSGASQPSGPVAGTGDRTGAETGARPSGGADTRDICADLGGEWRTHAAGRCLVVERQISADTVHGETRVATIAERLNRASASARLLDGHVRLPFLFFDLETTGLSGGAGTYAFLVGCGRCEADGSFVTTQYLLTRFNDERPLLHMVDEALAPAGALVTFNGKSFDAPVMETRYLFHRLTSRVGDLPHLDLLHPARRFWRRRRSPNGVAADEGGCSLTALETEVLATSRKGDVPGFEIPARYFGFVRSGDARPLRPVLEHNRLDLLSLAALTARMCHLLEEGVEAARTPSEALALGGVYARSGDEGRAKAALTRVTDTARDPEIVAAARRGLAVLARRARRFDEAALQWRLLLECRGCSPQLEREASEALAIHHEHRVRDFESARAFALRSLREGGSRPSWAAAVHHRVTRIERKMKARTGEALSARLELGD